MGEVHLVLVVLELYAEGQGVELLCGSDRPFLAWVVLYLVPSPVPPGFLQFCLFLAVNERLHAVVVERVGLDQIDYVELVHYVFASVAGAEEEPLALLGRSTVVELQLQIVFELSNLSCPVQVSAFKSRFK